MIDSNYYPQPKNALSPGVLLSIVSHVVLIGLFVIKAAFFKDEKIDYSNAVRVDLVALPDKLQPNLEPKDTSTEKNVTSPPKPEPTPTPAVKPAEPIAAKTKILPPKVNVDKEAIKLDKELKTKQLSAIEKLKAQAALERIKEDVKKDTLKKNAPPQVVKGNVLSPGSAITGLNKVQEQSYLSRLDAHIKSNWSLPQWLATKNYKAQIRVQFDEQGQIVSRQIVKSSGQQTYDEMALATIDRSVPFPAPPEKFSAIFKVDGVLIGFPE